MASIIRLPISSSEIVSTMYSDIIEYDPNDIMNEPMAVNDDHCDTSSESGVSGIRNVDNMAPIISDDVISDSVVNQRLMERKQSITDRIMHPNNDVSACKYKSDNNTIVKICEWELLRDFKDGCSIPESTSMACFHCVHPFTTQPVVVPVNHYETFCHNGVTLNNVWIVTGNFCSWRCQKKYIMCGERELCDSMQLNQNQLLSLSCTFFKKCYTSNISYYDIIPAPSRYALHMFGGPLSITEFRGVHDRFTLLMSPIICITPKLKQQYEIVSDMKDDDIIQCDDISEQAMFPGKSGSYDKSFRLKRTTKPPNQKCRLNTFFGQS